MILHHTAITQILSNGRRAKALLWQLDQVEGKRLPVLPTCIAQSIIDLAGLAGNNRRAIPLLVNDYLADLKAHKTIISPEHVTEAVAIRLAHPALQLHDAFVVSAANQMRIDLEQILCIDNRFRKLVNV